MIQALPVKTVTLRDLIDSVGLKLVRQDDFFQEWQEELPQITAQEQEFLDRVKEGYFNLINYPPLLEKTIQISVLSPILFLAKFFLPPFHIQAEKSIEITANDEGVTIRGQLDILRLREQFWVMVIESKQAAFSIEAGLAQLLAYMLGNPHAEKPGFGLVTNGGSFIFVKLIKRETPQYATSNQFDIRNRGNALYDVFRILKRISQL